MEGDERLAALLQFVDRLLDDLVDLDGIDRNPRQPHQRAADGARILKECIALGAGGLLVHTLIDHLGISLALGPSDKGADPKRGVDHEFDHRRHAVHRFLVDGDARVVRQPVLELQVGQVVIPAQVGAILAKHRCEALLRSLAAGGQFRQDPVQPAAFGIRQQRNVEVGPGRIAHRRRGCVDDIAPSDGFDHRPDGPAGVRGWIDRVVGFVQDQQCVLVRSGSGPGRSRTVRTSAEQAVVRQDQVAARRPRARLEDGPALFRGQGGVELRAGCLAGRRPR